MPGGLVKNLRRKHGFSDASYHLWRSLFGGMTEAKRQTELKIQTPD